MARLEVALRSVVRWFPPEMSEGELDGFQLPTGARLAYDIDQHPVVLFVNEWSMNYFTQTHAKVALTSLPPAK